MPLNFLLEEDFQRRLSPADMAPLLCALAAVGLGPWIIGLGPLDPFNLDWLFGEGGAVLRAHLDWVAAVTGTPLAPGTAPVDPTAAAPLLVRLGQAGLLLTPAPFQLIGPLLYVSLGLTAYAAARVSRALGAGAAPCFLLGLIMVLNPAAVQLMADPLLYQVWPILLAVAVALEGRRKAITWRRAVGRVALILVAGSLHLLAGLWALIFLTEPLVRLALRREAKVAQRRFALLLMLLQAKVLAALWMGWGNAPGLVPLDQAFARLSPAPLVPNLPLVSVIGGGMALLLAAGAVALHPAQPAKGAARVPLWSPPVFAALLIAEELLLVGPFAVEQVFFGIIGLGLCWLTWIGLLLPVWALAAPRLAQVRPAAALILLGVCLIGTAALSLGLRERVGDHGGGSGHTEDWHRQPVWADREGGHHFIFAAPATVAQIGRATRVAVAEALWRPGWQQQPQAEFLHWAFLAGTSVAAESLAREQGGLLLTASASAPSAAACNALPGRPMLSLCVLAPPGH